MSVNHLNLKQSSTDTDNDLLMPRTHKCHVPTFTHLRLFKFMFTTFMLLKLFTFMSTTCKPNTINTHTDTERCYLTSHPMHPLVEAATILLIFDLMKRSKLYIHQAEWSASINCTWMYLYKLPLISCATKSVRSCSPFANLTQSVHTHSDTNRYHLTSHSMHPPTQTNTMLLLTEATKRSKLHMYASQKISCSSMLNSLMPMISFTSSATVIQGFTSIFNDRIIISKCRKSHLLRCTTRHNNFKSS